MSLPKCKDFTDYNKYPGEENPTTDAQMQEYMDNQNQLMKAASAMMWQPSSEYDVGDIVVSPAMPANTEAVCVTAGMTDSVLEPSWTTGNNIPDGSCFWKLRYVHYTSFLATEEDAVAGTDTEKIMTPATSKYAIEKLAGLPIGHEWWTANPNIPVGCLPLFGGTFSRTAYKDLWAWVQAQGSYLITEAEWQAKATANEGNVPFYSTGDGSTTFRVPSLSCWVKGANGVSEVGSYLEAGLPNITGTASSFRAMNGYAHEYSGALYDAGGGAKSDNANAGTYNSNFGIDASLSSPIYGNSDTVQPPSIVGMYLVKAFGTVSNIGNQDIADISAGLTRVETTLATIAPPVGTVIAQAGNYAPDGYLMCNGAAVSRTTYANLFAKIGTTYGAGDGSATFSLPNLTDRFIQGSTTAGTTKEAGLPNITGSFTLRNQAKELSEVSGTFSLQGTDSGTHTGASSNKRPYVHIAMNAQKSSSVYGASNTVQPPAVTMRYYIKY